MDSTLIIKKKIHEFIENADDRILRIFSAIIATEEETIPSLPKNFYKELEKRREKHLNGESKSYSWEEVKSRARETIK